MANIYIGSARHDENGHYLNGAVGDSLQKNATFDDAGEVSMQLFYKHAKGWVIIRPAMPGQADKLAEAMKIACNNSNLGYDQNQRLGVVKYGIKSAVATECDCSSLVRACVKYAMNTDVGNFTTANALQALIASKLFINKGTFTDQKSTPVYNGDILCTKTKGHIVIVVQGNPRTAADSYYPACNKNYTSIIEGLKSVGETDTSLANRKRIGLANNLTAAVGTANGNTQMLNLLKAGKLKKA